MSPGAEDDIPRHNRCELCDKPVGPKRPWVLLNRYGIGGGPGVPGRSLVEVQNDEGDCVWEVTEEPDGDDIISGTMLCLQPCLVVWLEGKLLEIKVTLRGGGDA